MQYHHIDRYITLKETAEYLNVSKETLYLWVKEKKIPAYKLGRFWKFKISEIDKWMNCEKKFGEEKKKYIFD